LYFVVDTLPLHGARKKYRRGIDMEIDFGWSEVILLLAWSFLAFVIHPLMTRYALMRVFKKRKYQKLILEYLFQLANTKGEDGKTTFFDYLMGEVFSTIWTKFSTSLAGSKSAMGRNISKAMQQPGGLAALAGEEDFGGGMLEFILPEKYKQFAPLAEWWLANRGKEKEGGGSSQNGPNFI
jgi:hypothetical protein